MWKEAPMEPQWTAPVRDWAHYGRFVVLDRPKRIEHTWVSEGTRGLESVITLTFEAKGDQSLVTLRHTGVPDDDFGHHHADGWALMLAMVQRRFANRARGLLLPVSGLASPPP